MSTNDEMRGRLLHAALDVLRREGATGLTVRNITDRAGCSTTGIYTYFGGKHGLVEAIYLEGFDSFAHVLDPWYVEVDLLGAGRAYRRWALENPTHYLVMFGSAVPDFVPGDEAMARAATAFAALVGAVDRVGAADPVAAAYHVFATVHGYVMLELVGMGPVQPDRLEVRYEQGLRDVLASIR